MIGAGAPGKQPTNQKAEAQDLPSAKADEIGNKGGPPSSPIIRQTNPTRTRPRRSSRRLRLRFPFTSLALSIFRAPPSSRFDHLRPPLISRASHPPTRPPHAASEKRERERGAGREAPTRTRCQCGACPAPSSAPPPPRRPGAGQLPPRPAGGSLHRRRARSSAAGPAAASRQSRGPRRRRRRRGGTGRRRR